MMKIVKDKGLNCRIYELSREAKIYNFDSAEFIQFMIYFDPKYTQDAFRAIQQFNSSKIIFDAPDNARNYCH